MLLRLHINMKNKFISKWFYNLSGLVCFLLLVPIIIYIFCITIFDDYKHNGFMISSIILANVALIGIIFIVVLNLIILKKRKFIYNEIIKSKKLYDEGIRKLNSLSKLPQTRYNLSCTMLYFAYTKMFQTKFTESLEYFEEIKEYDAKYKMGVRNSVLASYYEILIYYYLGDIESLKKELHYFNVFRKKLNIKLFENIINCIDAIEKNNINGIIESLRNQTNPFVALLIKKIS